MDDNKSCIYQVQELIAKQRHEGKVSFLARNRKSMKLVYANGESEEIMAGPKVRFGEFVLGSTVRVKAPDHSQVVWSKVEPAEGEKKERVKRKHATFDMDLLKSNKGLKVIAEKFPKVKFKGPGYEAADLRKLMECYKDWASELYPKFTFHHIVRKLELMGTSKDVKMYMGEARLDFQVLKQDEAISREQAQQHALNPTESEGVDIDAEKRQRMEQNKQAALARLAQKKLQEQATKDVPTASRLYEDADYDEDVDAAIADQYELGMEDLG